MLEAQAAVIKKEHSADWEDSHTVQVDRKVFEMTFFSNYITAHKGNAKTEEVQNRRR